MQRGLPLLPGGVAPTPGAMSRFRNNDRFRRLWAETQHSTGCTTVRSRSPGDGPVTAALPATGPRHSAAGHGSRSRPARRWSALVLASLLTSVLVVGAATVQPAPAQTIDDLRSQAERLDGELASAQDRLIELAEEYNRATADRDMAVAAVTAAEQQLEATRLELDQRATELRSYAVQAYVDGGTMRDVEGVLATDAAEVGRRVSYLSTAVGNRKTLVEGLRAGRANLEKRTRQVRSAQADVEAQVGRLTAARVEADAITAELTERTQRTKGRLAELVAEAEARRQAEERRAAEEAARQQGLLVQQSVRVTNTTSPPAAPSTAASPSPPAAAAPAPGAVSIPVPAARPEAGLAVAAAMSQLGVPYVWGGASPSQGFDCSGLMQWAWRQAGRDIARPADYQRDGAIPLTYEQLQPGDLVFYGQDVSHVGMYIGNDEIINSPQTGEVVSIKTMWYSRKPMTYGRIA